MSKARDLADFISTGSILSDGTIESTEINGVTADASELNVLDGVTVTTEELNVLDGITVTTEELNNVAGISTSVQTQLDGKQDVVAGVSDTEIGYLDGVTSSLQTQLDNISVTSGSLTKSFTSGETASITLAQAISPAPVVSATKEVAQAGISSKGSWDVNATASNYELHNTAYDTTLTPASLGYQISSASYDSKSFNTTKNSNDLAFKDDGTKVYYVGNNNYVWQRTLSTAWDISTAGSATSFDQSSQDSDPRDVTFKTDGTKMYLNGDSNNRVFQYSLSTAWDITTATYDNKSHLTTNQTSSPFSTEFKSDGTKMYITGGGAMYEYSLSTAWDVSTASYTSNSFTFTSQDTYMRGIFLKPDGTKLYAVGNDNDSVFEYTFGTAWDLSTLSYSGTSYALPNGTNPTGIAFSTDGTKLYNTDFSNALIYQYSTGSLALVLGTGSFASTDVGKRIQGNGGDVILTSTSGAYDTTGGSAFTDSSTIASGSWSMRGLKSAGASSGLGITGVTELGALNLDGVTYVNRIDVGAQDSDPRGIRLSNDGTKMFVAGFSNNEIFEYNLSTAFEVNTASYNNISYVLGGTITSLDVVFNNDGTKMYVPSHSPSPSRVYEYNLSTAFDLSTVSATSNTLSLSSQTGTGAVHGICFNDDGTKFYVSASSSYVYQYALTTAFDLSTGSYVQSYNANAQVADITGVNFNKDGTSMYVLDNSSDDLYQYTLTTPYDVSTAYYAGKTLGAQMPETENEGFCFANDFTRMYMAGSYQNRIYGYTTSFSETLIQPTSQYHIATTNSGGQIDTAFWTDLNTMVADQAAGSGTVHYAVSTDDRTTWSVIKEGSGVRPIVRDNSGTWQYNSDVGSFDNNNLSLANYANDSFTFSNVGGNYTVDSFWSTDGTKLFIIKGQYIAEMHLSTAYDLSTAVYNDLFDLGGQDTVPFSLWMNSTGERAYVSGGVSDTIYQYSMSTGFDLGPFSYTGNSINVQAQDTENRGIWFGPEDASLRPTKMFMIGGATSSVYEYSMSTAGNLSTASYSNKSFSVSTQQGDCSGLAFSADGTVMFVSGRSPEGVHQYSLSTAWDISTASYSNVFYDTTSFVTLPYGVSVSSNGQYLLIADETSGYVYNVSIGGYAYGTSTTWTNSTTNDEFYALQQALGATAVNRMDKTQLDAVTDPNHYTLGDTLDLAIALRTDTASASTPTADGVTINYDAASLNQGAVLGTDYDYDFPDSTTVRVTSNAAQNLKIRVV